MAEWMPIVWLLAGLAGLIVGSDWAVDGARALALRFGLTPAIVGVTIAAVGTSFPEMATNVAVAFDPTPGGADGIAVGNVVGSCLSQITLLLGVTAWLQPLRVSWPDMRRFGGGVLGALVLMALTTLDGRTERWEGALLMLVYVAYVVWLLARRARSAVPLEDEGEAPVHLRAMLLGLFGLVVLTLSAEVVVRNGVILAGHFGVGNDVIGLWVGVTTGLPELAFALRSVREKAPMLAVGNLLGSNITDPLASFGLGTMIRGVEVTPLVLFFDIPVWGICTLLALALLVRKNGLTRGPAALLIAIFVGYTGLRVNL